jgi:polar amino acid transport system permease protein
MSHGLDWDWHYAWSVLPTLLTGLKITVVATFFGALLAFFLGLAWTFFRMKRIIVITPVVEFVVLFIRGTPLLVQVYFAFYVFPKWGLSMPTLTTGIVAIGISYSAYASEIYRAGIEDLPSGQWEAALVLGLPIRRVWFGIILPQSLRAVLPMLGNLVVSMFKETSIMSTITVMELLAQATSLGTINYRYVEPLTLAGLLYFIVSYASARGLRQLEAKNVAHG